MKAMRLKERKFQINDLNLHLKEIEKEKTKRKTHLRKEITRIKAEKIEIENKNKTTDKTNTT